MLNVRFRERPNTWPGFVDLFSNLVIILIFLLIVFVFLWTTTSVFNRANGAKTIAELRQTNESQAITIQQITADEQEAKRQLGVTQTEVEILSQANMDLVNELKEMDLSVRDLVTAYEGKLQTITEQLDRAAAYKTQVAELEQQLSQANMEKAQIAELQQELAKVRAALSAAEQESADAEARYVEMSNQLNKALADKVAELQNMAKYQSAFYKAISTALATDDNAGVRPDGDRFIVSSDILFPSGSYKLSADGKKQLQLIANVIKEFEKQIPDDVNWIIRIDGHTDDKAVIPGTRGYRDNMELSLLRATAVADELARDGVAKRRLIPSGFGDTNPVATGTDAASLQKNRRIELQLTNR